MSKATIYIPTRGRVGNQKTWESISPKWRERTFLVTNSEDEADSLEMLGYPVLLSPTTGIADKRQWIVENHDRKLGNVVMMLDDDFIFAERRKDEPSKFIKVTTAEQWDTMMDRAERMMDFVAWGGISSRGGANRIVSPYRFISRINGAMLLNLDLTDTSFRFDKTTLMEDFSMGLQHLTRGYPTMLLNMFTYDDSHGPNADGGCSSYRDAALQLEAVMELQEMFPDFVSIVSRPGWKGMGPTRPDVRIQWAKAYQYGQEVRSMIGQPNESYPKFDLEGNLYS